MRARRWRGAVVVLTLVVAACAGEDLPSRGELAATSSTTTSVVAVRGLFTTLHQFREDETRRTLQVRVHNSGRDPVVVERLALRWPGLDAPPASPGYRVFPGTMVDLPVAYGAARCARPPRLTEKMPADRPEVAATVRFGDGPAIDLVLPVADGLGVLERIFVPDCRRQGVEAAVGLRWTGAWAVVATSDGPAADGFLTVERRRAQGPIDVVRLSGSVLLELSPPDPRATLAPGSDRLDLPVTVRPAGRCDGHALGESKQTFVFQVGLRIDGKRTDVTVVPDPDTQAALYETVRVRCGLPPR